MADLKFRALLDDSDYKKKFAALQQYSGKAMADMFERVTKKSAKNMEDMIKRINAAMAKAGGVGGTGETKAASDATNKLTEAKLAAANAAKLEKEAQLAYMTALRQSRLEIQSQREAQAAANKNLAEGRITIQEYRKEIAKLNLEEKKRRIAEREARKAAAGSGEYQQLNKALGALRKESKDVLAEMFRLERQGKKNSVAYQELASRSRDLVAQTNVLDKGIKQIDASLGLHQRNVGNYGSALDVISPQFARLNGQLAMMGVNLSDLAGKRNSFQMLGTTIAAVGKSILAFLLSPIGLAITAIGSLFMLFNKNKQTVIDFNNGLLNVAKTTGLAGAELDALSDSIIQLSRRLQTVGTDKLLEYATVAGQLGVKGAANIMAFTEALAKLETASNISGEEGGAEIARLLTLVDGGVQNVQQFGDEIVNLGNNFAATEKEILSNAEAIAQNTGLYRIGRQEVLAYATATKSLGIEAEVVGSTFQKTLGSFEKAIRSGKGLDQILKVVGGSAADLQRRFNENASGVFQDYIKGLNAIHKAGGSVNAQMEQNGITDIRSRRVIGTLAAGYDTLAAAMEKVKDAAGALDAEFKQKAGSIENQTNRIKIAWENLVLSIENGSGAIGVAATSVAGAFASILESITAVVSSESWREFFLRMGGKSMFGANMMGGSARDIMANASRMVDKRNALKQNDTWGFMLEEFKQASKDVQEAELKAQREALAYFEKNHIESEIDDLERLRKHVDDLASAYEDMHGPTTPPTPTPETDPAAEELSKQQQRERETAIRNQRQLQRQIDEINQQSLRSTMSTHEQEVEAVRDKYRKIRETIEEFRNDPKNKGMAVDASGLTAAQAREEAQVRYRQETTALMQELGVQRQLWQDYESWRLELGEDSANERYAKELEVAINFKDRLAQEIASIGTMLTASLSGTDAPKLTGVEEERLKQLQEMMRQIESQEQKRRDDNLKRLYADYASFEQKRVKARAKANKDIADLDEDGKKRRLKALEDELAELYKMEVEGDAELQEFLKVADNAGSAIALRAMKHGKEAAMRLIDGFTKDPQVQARLRKEFAEFFDKGIAALEVENFGNVVQLVDGFDRLVQSAEQFDGTLSTALKTIGSMVSQVGQLAKTLGDTMGELGGNLSKGGGYMAIVGALFSAFGTMINISEARSERVVEHQREMGRLQIQQLDATTRLLERQLQLVQEIYGTERVYSYAKVISDTTQTISDALADVAGKTFAVYTGTGLNQDGVARFNQEFKGSLAELDAAIKESEKKSKNFWNIVTGTSSTHSRDAMALRKMREAFLNGQQWSVGFDHISDITQEGINEIYEILEKGGLGDVVESQLKNIVEQWELWRDAMNQLNQELTGTTFQSITDEIVSMFREGKVAAEDFANSFEKLMQNAVLQSFKRKYLEEALQGWYDEFAGATESGGGLDSGEVEKLQQGYNSIIESARKGLEEMQKVTGTNIGAGQTQNQGALSGRIAASCTEATALEIKSETIKFNLSCQHLEC